MRIPKKIRIGKKSWKVIQAPNLTDELGLPICGLCDYVAYEIWVDSTLRPKDRYVTFLHEIMHAVAKKGTGLSRRQEEFFIGSVDDKLYDVLVRNRLFSTQKSSTYAKRKNKKSKR